LAQFYGHQAIDAEIEEPLTGAADAACHRPCRRPRPPRFVRGMKEFEQFPTVVARGAPSNSAEDVARAAGGVPGATCSNIRVGQSGRQGWRP